MTIETVSPQQAQKLIDEGAKFVDIREQDEYIREHILNALSWPVSRWNQQSLPYPADTPVIFHCRSGMRTKNNAGVLESLGSNQMYLLEGGLDAWKKAGFPVRLDKKQPIDLMRQVQITAGSLILIGTVLGLGVSPWFFALTAFVGAGLLFAGVTGFCGMARLLARMPWNKRA